MKKFLLCLFTVIFICGCQQEITYQSINNDATLYKNKGCVIFYPNNKDIENYAKKYCEEEKEEVVDYIVEPFYDFVKVVYPSGEYFMLNKDFSNIDLQIVDKKMLSELFIYEYKKSENDIAYSSDFLRKNHFSNIDVNDFVVTYDNEKITIKSLTYDFSFDLDLGYSKQLLNADFGEYKEYRKVSYVSNNRPMVALTYDDGPYRKIDSELFNIYDLYDSRCTFFIVGNRIGENELNSIKEGIELGNEYGSHSYRHDDIRGINATSAFETMIEPSTLLNEELGYKMKTYRQPYGYRNYAMEELLKNNGLTGVSWNVDSLDWKTRDKDSTYNEIVTHITENDVVLMHSLYDSTLEATRMLIPELIDSGYQLVTVSELIDYLEFDGNQFFGK